MSIIVVKPIRADLTHDTELIGKMVIPVPKSSYIPNKNKNTRTLM
jgi:hypothetical protein